VDQDLGPEAGALGDMLRRQHPAMKCEVRVATRRRLEVVVQEGRTSVVPRSWHGIRVDVSRAR